MARGLHIGLEGDNTGQAELGGGASDYPVIFGDDVDALEEDCLEAVLPAPEGQGIVTQGPEVGIEDEGRTGFWRKGRMVHVVSVLDA
jgi:hypothetical protein